MLENSGTCPWPDSLEWVYVDGETFGFEDDPIVVAALNPGEQTTITADFTAPSRAGRFDSTWQLTDAATGSAIGEPLEFTLGAYLEATPTPTPTNTPV
ncbi:MAG: hypothetical protein IPM39_26035, partial [Chloroflexi bacterium]|nr:hypothetical protein [Chloroflexota bacterium]